MVDDPVLPEIERTGVWVRPFRSLYVHMRCLQATQLRQDVAQTYARDPSFYKEAFCYHCGHHYPVKEFRWLDDSTAEVGS